MSTRRFSAVFFDVDGVLTDGKVWIDSNGETNSLFSVKDGAAIRRLIAAGVIVGIISGRKSCFTYKRFTDIGCHFVETGVLNKLSVALRYCDKFNIESSSVLYVGDDLVDQECIELFHGVCPSDAHSIIKNVSRVVLGSKGGEDLALHVENLFFNGI